MDLIQRVEGIVAAVRAELAADPRTSIFEVDVLEEGETVVVVGVTSELEAAAALNERLGRMHPGRPVRVEVVRLPLEEERLTHALCVTSLAPMLWGPSIADLQVSQVVLGQRLLVYRRHGRWFQCRSEDGYLGWLHRGYLRLVEGAEARDWLMGTGGEPCMALEAVAIDEDGSRLAVLPWGARVVAREDGRVRLPDGREVRVDGELVRESERARRFPLDGERIVETAKAWMGTPYVWGGVTRAGVDCSGLVQVVFRTHGVELPRDSDQQALLGQPVDPGPDFGALRAGDLLYFAEEGPRISHVAISRGGGKVIHAAIGNGGVSLNDLNGGSAFEQEMRSLFVCARRIVGGEEVGSRGRGAGAGT